jgi:hypothetical protein
VLLSSCFPSSNEVTAIVVIRPLTLTMSCLITFKR